MPASPRRRARCNRHEARAGIVALISCCLVRLSSGGLGLLGRLSHCQRARSEVFAVVPLQRAAWTRWFSVVISEAAAKRCSMLCSTEQNQSDFRATQRTWPTDKPLPSRPKKISYPQVSASPLVLQLCRCSIGFPHVWRTTFCNPEDPDAHGDDSSFFVVAQQQWRACVRRMLRCKLACILPPLLSGSQISFRSVHGCEGGKS